MDPGSTKPSWRSGNTHGFCVTGGHPPIASEPTPSPRLWAAAPGATPVRLCEHTMRVGDRTPKTGTFYLAGNRNFLFGSDRRGPPDRVERAYFRLAPGTRPSAWPNWKTGTGARRPRPHSAWTALTAFSRPSRRTTT